jgi:hypothetical protein
MLLAIFLALLVFIFVMKVFEKTLFCKHKWKVLSEVVTESKAEHMLRIAGKSPSPRNEYDLEPLVGRKHIQILVCEKNCGALKRFVEKI